MSEHENRATVIEAGGHFKCLYPDRWQEESDFHREIRESLKRLESKVDSLADDHGDLHKRVFVGNGQPAMFVQLREHEQTIQGMLWTVRAVAAAVIGIGCKLIFGKGAT